MDLMDLRLTGFGSRSNPSISYTGFYLHLFSTALTTPSNLGGYVTDCLYHLASYHRICLSPSYCCLSYLPLGSVIDSVIDSVIELVIDSVTDSLTDLAKYPF